MPDPFISNLALKTVVANSLKKNMAHLNATDYWDTIIGEQNQAAADEIRARLQARGFTSTQVEDWDRKVTFNKMIGLYWCLVEGGCLDAFDDRFIERLRVHFLESLDTVAVLNNGILQSPLDINTGPMLTHEDMFGTPIDEDDPRIGETVEF